MCCGPIGDGREKKFGYAVPVSRLCVPAASQSCNPFPDSEIGRLLGTTVPLSEHCTISCTAANLLYSNNLQILKWNNANRLSV